MAKLQIGLRDRLLLSIDEVASVLGIGRDLVYRLVLDINPATGKVLLYSVKVGRRRMVSWRALDKFIEEGASL